MSKLPENHRRLGYMVGKYIKAGQPCILCKSRAVFGACFIPDDPHLYCPSLPRAGKLRVLFYALCKICSETEGVCDHVEEMLKEKQVPNIRYISNKIVDDAIARDFKDLKENKAGK